MLVSDGEDLENFAPGRISRLAASGIKVFTLSVGTEAGAVIYHPVLQEEAFTRANLENMQRIATLGGGNYTWPRHEGDRTGQQKGHMAGGEETARITLSSAVIPFRHTDATKAAKLFSGQAIQKIVA